MNLVVDVLGRRRFASITSITALRRQRRCQLTTMHGVNPTIDEYQSADIRLGYPIPFSGHAGHDVLRGVFTWFYKPSMEETSARCKATQELHPRDGESTK